MLRVLSARARLRLGDLLGAHADATEIATWLAARHGEYAKAHLLVLRAELVLMAADLTAAPALVREALESFARLPAPAERAWAAVECSRLAIQRGLDGQLAVHDWLREAAEAYDVLGDEQKRK